MRKLVSFLAVAAGVSLIAAQSQASDLLTASPTTDALATALNTQGSGKSVPSLATILAEPKSQSGTKPVQAYIPQSLYPATSGIGNQSLTYYLLKAASNDHRTYKNIPECWIVDTLKVSKSGVPTEIIGHNQYGEHSFGAPKMMGIAPTTVQVTPVK